jgi:hypothetical protein
MQPKSGLLLLVALPSIRVKLKSPQALTHNPHPLQRFALTVIFAGSFVLDVGIAIIEKFLDASLGRMFLLQT